MHDLLKRVLVVVILNTNGSVILRRDLWLFLWFNSLHTQFADWQNNLQISQIPRLYGTDIHVHPIIHC